MGLGSGVGGQGWGWGLIQQGALQRARTERGKRSHTTENKDVVTMQ